MPNNILENVSNLHVVVIGDIMLDCYRWGETERISPEAPVPIVNIYRTDYRLGGAANVALNCKALGAQVSLAGMVGNDDEGSALLHLLNEKEINTQLVFQSNLRPTTSKTRILSRNQQILRLDNESTTELGIQEEHSFIDAVLRFLQIQKPDVVIFEDYNKGLLKENVITRTMEHCRHLNIVTAVDPKKHNFLSYKEADIFKPNLKEVKEGLNIELSDINLSNLKNIHKILRDQLNHKISLITLSEHGLFYQENDSLDIIPSYRRNISDVSGAGDTVIAVAAIMYSLTRDVGIMAKVANIAGGLVCEEVGVVPIDLVKLQNEINKIDL